MSSPPTAPPSAGATAETAESRELARWQRKLLPFMSRFLVVLAIGFFALSLVNVYEMRNFIQRESEQAIRVRMEELLRAQGSGPRVDVMQQGLLLLEAEALDKRYRQASALLMSRIWTRQLAFITGMVLAFIGSVFIIGKLTESKSDVNLGGADWKAGISSASPGLVLAFFGTVLMGIALVVQTQVEVQDRPVYFMTVGMVKDGSAGKAANTEPPKPLPDPFGDSSSSEKGTEEKTK